MGAEAQQSYNGGIIFVSYLISVAGAQTTLELLTRRTHIRGYYNWYKFDYKKKTPKNKTKKVDNLNI